MILKIASCRFENALIGTSCNRFASRKGTNVTFVKVRHFIKILRKMLSCVFRKCVNYDVNINKRQGISCHA